MPNRSISKPTVNFEATLTRRKEGRRKKSISISWALFGQFRLFSANVSLIVFLDVIAPRLAQHACLISVSIIVVYACKRWCYQHAPHHRWLHANDDEYTHTIDLVAAALIEHVVRECEREHNRMLNFIKIYNYSLSRDLIDKTHAPQHALVTMTNTHDCFSY